MSTENKSNKTDFEYCNKCGRYQVVCLCMHEEEDDTFIRAMMEHADDTDEANLVGICKKRLGKH